LNKLRVYCRRWPGGFLTSGVMDWKYCKAWTQKNNATGLKLFCWC